VKRYFTDKKLEKLCIDFPFMVKKIKNSKWELDIRLRNNYLNLYYKGNSLSKITPRTEQYEIDIHEKFCRDIFKNERRVEVQKASGSQYYKIKAEGKDLPHLFQKKYLDKLLANIKKVNYGEETTFEQMLITDNLNRKDLIIIDRQITEPGMKGRMDLLGLRNRKENQFSFEVIEVKLGNNKELANDVGVQLNRYIDHIKKHIKDWSDSYEETYRQMKTLGLFENYPWDEIIIDNNVSGIVVVSGYSGIAKESIQKLKNRYSDIRVKLLENKI